MPGITRSPSSSSDSGEDDPYQVSLLMRTSEDSTSLLIGAPQNIEDAYDVFLSRMGLTCKMLTIIICSGIGLLSDTLEVMSISFAKDDIANQFKLSRQEESTLAGALFAGMLIGGLVWGRAADIYGRRRVLLISLTMNGSCAALSALSTEYWMFLIARCFSGIGVGGSLPVIFAYVSEWVPRRVKGGVISAVATCWMVGSVLAAALAWVTLPHTFHAGPFWKSWRVYLMICSIPSVFAASLYGYLYESPVFLMEKGKKQEAISVLKNYASDMPAMQHDLRLLKRLIKDRSKELHSDNNGWMICMAIKNFLVGTIELFSPRLRKLTFLLMTVILPVHFGYYGFMLWFPEYIRNQPNSTEIIEDPNYVYRESLYVALASVPGNLLSIVLTDKVGPKRILCVSQVLAAGSVFLLWKFNSPSQTILLSCVFNAVTAPIFNMVDLLIPSLYPTQSRGTAFGFHTALIRIVMIIATWLFSMFIDTSPTVPILLTAILMGSSAIFSLLVPSIPSDSH